MWRIRADLVHLHHYWASDTPRSNVERPEDEPPEYELAFDPKTHALRHFGVVQNRTTLHWPRVGLTIFRSEIESIHGEIPATKRRRGFGIWLVK